LPGDDGLARHCDIRDPRAAPALTVEKNLTWADRHEEQAGRAGGREESRPRPGQRLPRLPGGSSLAQLPAAERGKRQKSYLPRLTVK
jgi:hypothetical protein